jgi:transcription initiation factor TFIID TATA-box-binding protein
MRKRKYTPLCTSSDVTSLVQPPPMPHVCSNVCGSSSPIDPLILPTVPCPTIHNIVSTSQIKSDQIIDLPLLSMILPYSFYDRQRFAAITIRLKSPDCTTLLFSSGKLVVTGGRNWYECVLASQCVCRILRDSFPAREFNLVNCEIQNIVAHVELPLNSDEILDLQSMYNKLELHCMYQKTMFPGLIYRPESSPVVLLCFYSGKIVITGGKTTQDVYEGWKKLWPTVRVFMRKKQ